MTESDDAIPGPPPLMELARQLISERTRPRDGWPKGYEKTEIPRDICSSKTLSRLESGRYRGLKLGTVLALCNFYRTPPDLADHLANLVKAARARDWCSHYASALDDNGWFYQQCEDNASYLAFHSSARIPSLIQGPAYYRRIRDTTNVDFDEAPDWERGLEFRRERRKRWIESERPALFLIGEATLAVDLGPEKEEILADLHEIAALPFADVRIIPFSAGPYELQAWTLRLLEYDAGEETIINVESPGGRRSCPAIRREVSSSPVPSRWHRAIRSHWRTPEMTEIGPWRKSSRSANNQNDSCVEVRLNGDAPQVSDSKLADDRPILTVSASSYEALLAWVKGSPNSSERGPGVEASGPRLTRPCTTDRDGGGPENPPPVATPRATEERHERAGPRASLQRALRCRRRALGAPRRRGRYSG
ncbi:hypothetical protein GCM10029992_24880 [Glycomyces albus]